MLCNIRRIHAGEAAHLRDISFRALSGSPRAFGETIAADSERLGAYWEELATARSDGDDGAAFVAEAEGAWVGIAVGVRRFDQLNFVAELGSVHMGWMWVASEARSAGLGLQLPDEVLAWAGDTGARGRPVGDLRQRSGALVVPAGRLFSRRRAQTSSHRREP
jgi:GNAT superfamily N-acetyltransferase